MTTAQLLVLTWMEWAAAGAVLLLVARLALGRITQPADRILLILMAFGTATILPVLAMLAPIPAWRLGVVSSSRTEAIIAPAVSTDVPTAAMPRSSASVAAAPPQRPSALDHTPGSSVAPPAAVKTETSRPRPTFDLWSLAAGVLVTAYAGIAIAFAARWIAGSIRLRRLVSDSAPASDELRAIWNEVTAGRGASVALRVSNDVDTPLAFGWLSPTVVVPAAVAAADARTLRFCLAHEWSHLERRDLPAWGLARLCQFGLWCQPLYWTLRRELRVCQDILADNRAASAGGDSIEYSELLVRFARNRMATPLAGAMALLDRPSQLTRRVKMLLASGRSLRLRSGGLFRTLAGAGVLTGAVLLSAVRLSALQAADGPEKTPAPEAKPETPPAEKPKDKPAEETLHYGGVVVSKGTDKGIPRATVTVRRSKLTAQENSIIEESRHTTDSDGKFQFVIPPEQVAIPWLYIELDVEHPDYAAKKGHGYALSMIRKNEPLGERPFFEKTELNPSDPVTGTVVDPGGKPLQGIKLQGYSTSNAADFREYGSFTDTVTDESGRFRLPMIKGGVGVMWILPKDFASTSRAIHKDRGELGTITLRPGVRTGGRVIGVSGEPVAGIPVNIEYQGEGNETVNDLPVATSIVRSAVTDKEGRFAFDPLPSGSYRVIPDEHRRDPIDRDRTQYKIPGVFLPLTVKLQEGTEAAPIEVQAAPHVVFHAQIYDSSGKKSRGHEFFLFGEIDKQFWFGQGKPDMEGTIAMEVPHGLQNVRIQLMTNEHGALRFRRGKGKELENRKDDIEFGTLNEDVEGFEIIKYKAPIVIVKAVDENQALVPAFRVSAAYPWGQQRYILEGEQRSDLSFEKQNDGRYRTSQMLPDEDVKFTVEAAGFETASETVRLPEGELKELVFTLKKAKDAAAPPADNKLPAAKPE